MSLHLAPNTPWIPLALALVALLALGVWAYRFSIPPLPLGAKRLLPLLRGMALALLALLLAQPVLERVSVGQPTVVVLLDRSRSMDLPVTSRGEPRRVAADRAVRDLGRVLGGRARVVVLPFAQHLGVDSLHAGSASVTALGDALDGLAESPLSEPATAAVVVSDGVSNAGSDPVEAARRLGLPVNAVLVGSAGGVDRSVVEIEAPSEAQAGRQVPVRVHVQTSEPAGTPIGVSLSAEGRQLARTTVVSPGPGAETVAELRATPLHPGLAVWVASVDSTSGEMTARNNARAAAFPVSPGRVGVTLVTNGLNWDLTFVRRALAADSSLALSTWMRDRSGWQRLEGRRGGGSPEAELPAAAVLILDGLAPEDVGTAFAAATTRLLERGGGILVLGGPPPGLARLRGTRLGSQLAFELAGRAFTSTALPTPAPEARDLLSWDDDPARGEQAWREAAPIADPVPLASGAGDRVLVRGGNSGPPLLFVRRAGRGQVMLVNGTGFWRWSLSNHDDLSAERGRRLWRGLVRWLAEPVQAEPLRVRPERWLSAGGEPVRVMATLQDEAFKPVAGAQLTGEVATMGGGSRRVRFDAGASGSYTATLEDLPPGHYRLSARATRGERTLGSATTEFAVDRATLEESRALPDSVTLAAVASATGGRIGKAGNASFARSLEMRRGAGRGSSVRLWESPYVFALVVGALGLEWAWRRRRGLP